MCIFGTLCNDDFLGLVWCEVSLIGLGMQPSCLTDIKLDTIVQKELVLLGKA